MAFHDHTCEECFHWDDVNGCWRDQPTSGPYDIACQFFDGPDDEDELEEDPD